MFPWNIAKSAEAMFSRWAVKRVCKFVLKKKLGQFILGDIDLDQLDVQLREGTIQLSDLALNVDCLNKKFGAAASVIIKEGSIGSLLVKMPWKGEGCLVEIDELELVLAPCLKNNSPAGSSSSCPVQHGNDGLHSDFQKVEHDMIDDASKSLSGDVHEGVKTIAKMVKQLLTSFHVKIKNLIVAFDPYLEKEEKNTRSRTTLVLRISETECRTCVSKDVILNSAARVDSFLGISQLTNSVKFRDAVLELLQIDDDNNKESSPCISRTSFGEYISGHSPSNTTTPVVTGKRGGFSGNIKLSIPWKNGSLDTHKVDADIHIDPVELRLQPCTIKWLLLLWGTLKNLDTDIEDHMHYNLTDSFNINAASYSHSSTPVTAHVTENVMPSCGGFPVDTSSLALQDSVTETLLPGSHVITDWLPFAVHKNHKDCFEEELDFGASVDQFFECFDGIRSSQSALTSSGIWNWTSSVFSAITAASSLASGSLHVPSEQQHVETVVKAAFAEISIMLSFHDEDQKHLCDPESDQVNVHHLGAECRDIVLHLQVFPQEIKFDGMVECIMVADYHSSESNAVNFGLERCTKTNNIQKHSIHQLQAEVQGALPPFASPAENPYSEEINSSVAANFPFINMGGVVKVTLLKTSGVTHCQYSACSSSSDGSITGPTSISLHLSPFVVWVNFPLINTLMNLSMKVVMSVEINRKRNELPSRVFNEKQGSSQADARRGSTLPTTSLSSTKSLRGSIMMPIARVILCFPFENGEDNRGYSSLDQFIVFDFSSRSALNMGVNKDTSPTSDASFQEKHFLTTTKSLHLHVGDLEIYLVSSGSEDKAGINSHNMQNKKFSCQNILSMTNKTGCLSVISMHWQEGHTTGPWIQRRAKLLATLGESRSGYKFVGKGYEFASVSTVKDLEGLNSQTRQEMILSSVLFFHVHLSPVTVTLCSSQYKVLHGLLNQVMNGLSSLGFDAANSSEASVSQTSLLVECDMVDISIIPDTKEDIGGSMQNELPGSWYLLKLKIRKVELLSVSNIGGINDAKLFWLAHGEGKLWGSITGVPEQEFLLISCSDSTLKRGDGRGSNALSSRLAGSDIVYLWEPESFHGFTSINVRCGTIVAIGGRLDWLDTVSSFFSLPSSPETEQAGDSSMQKGDFNTSYGSSFVLNFIDVGLSYQPYLRNLVDGIEVLDPKFYSLSAKKKECVAEEYVACLLAASSFNLTNSSVENSLNTDYKIRVQDLGLLLRSVSEPNILGGTYSVEHLHKVGYVRVAWEALIEVILRTNCKNGLHWEVECSKSHIYVETCHDTTTGLIRLASQLQQLFAPDVEESVVHLQARWNNIQKSQERNGFSDETRAFGGDSVPSTSRVCTTSVDTKSEPGLVGLMDEICEDAFQFNSNGIYQFDSSESHISVSCNESLLGDVCGLNVETTEISSHDLSINESMPVVGLDSSQTSFSKECCFPEFIEGDCLSKFSPPSELSMSKQSKPEIPKCRSMNPWGGDLETGNSGWYGDTFVRIVENHISEASEQSGVEHFEEGKLPLIDNTRYDDTGKVIGRIHLKKIDVRWRMYAGSDWHDSRDDGEHSMQYHGRDKTICLELSLLGIEFQYDLFPIGGVCASKLSLSVQDLHLYDWSSNAPWTLLLGYKHSKEHPRESSSKALKLELEAVRPDPFTPLEEYRLRIALLPILLHLHQSQLDFLIDFFGAKNLPVDPSPACYQESDGSKLFHGHTIPNEALLPFFQKFDIWPVVVRVDYSPHHVDLTALGSGKYVELVNLFPWKGVELQLKHVHAVGIYGWGSVCETIIGEWLEDVSQNQVHKLFRGLPAIRSLVAVGSSAVKLVSLPVENYKKDRRVLTGMQRGTAAFLRSISLEAVGLGVHLAAGAHDILRQAEYILASIPPSVPWTGQSTLKTYVRSDQPNDAQQGLQRAYESLSDGLGKSASALVRTPLKKYQRGAGAGSALASAIRAVPAAAIAPASACASAIHYTLLGFRNSLDPEHKKESMEKYLGPMQLSEQD